MFTFKDYINTDISRNMFKLQLRQLDTPEQHAIGLMNVKHLPENSGCLFVYPEQKQLSFWMKNCYIPLDLVFIDNNGILQEIYELKPMDETRVKSINSYKYAIEVNRGWFQRNNINIGERVLSIGN